MSVLDSRPYSGCRVASLMIIEGRSRLTRGRASGVGTDPWGFGPSDATALLFAGLPGWHRTNCLPVGSRSRNH
jgi:hypothetical protein